MTCVYDAEKTFVSLGNDGRTDALEVDDSFWPDLVSGKLGVGPGRLVSFYAFDGPWDSWEVHPNGDEIVMLVEGAAEMTLERPGGAVETVRLDSPGRFVVIERGTWHTARPEPSARMLFITDGEGTEHRPVDG